MNADEWYNNSNYMNIIAIEAGWIVGLKSSKNVLAQWIAWFNLQQQSIQIQLQSSKVNKLGYSVPEFLKWNPH